MVWTTKGWAWNSYFYINSVSKVWEVFQNRLPFFFLKNSYTLSHNLLIHVRQSTINWKKFYQQLELIPPLTLKAPHSALPKRPERQGDARFVSPAWRVCSLPRKPVVLAEAFKVWKFEFLGSFETNQTTLFWGCHRVYPSPGLCSPTRSFSNCCPRSPEAKALALIGMLTSSLTRQLKMHLWGARRWY